MKPGTGRHIAEALKALYAPPSPESKAEAEALAREHCARVKAGVARQQSETVSDLLSGSAETSGRCLRSTTTPAVEARCLSVADVEGAGDMAIDRATPPGDSTPLFRVA